MSLSSVTSALEAAQTYSRSPSSAIKYNKTDEPSSVFSLPFFSTHSLLSLSRARERGICTHLLHSLIQERINLFYGRKGRYTRETSDSIIAVMGNRIKCELAGVVHSWTYSCFEAPKVRDPRLEPVPHYSYYEDIRGNLEYIGP